MASLHKPTAKREYCPIIQEQVALNGVVVSLPGTEHAELANKRCSNDVQCMAKYGALDRIPNCMLISWRA